MDSFWDRKTGLLFFFLRNTQTLLSALIKVKQNEKRKNEGWDQVSAGIGVTISTVVLSVDFGSILDRELRSP